VPEDLADVTGAPVRATPGGGLARPIMPIEYLDDWEERLARQDAFWDREIIDRPVVCICLRRPDSPHPEPKAKRHATIRDRWMDASYVAERALARVMNTEFLGDALPCASPNLGPEVLSAFFGLEMEYDERTSWSIPSVSTWEDLENVRFSEDNFYWRKLIEITDALLEVGRGRFYTGLTDFHPGGDWIAALRGVEQLAVDLIEAPHQVMRLRGIIDEAYPRIYDAFHRRLVDADQAITAWPGIVSTRKWYAPSNDFSCMISKRMFDEFFLPGIVEECRHLEASIYHLDGPGALHHLESLLEVPELNAIQWVYGAGNGRASDWMHLYQRCQAAGKGLQIHIEPDELDALMENLRPGGLWISVEGVKDRDHAEALLRRASQWT